MNRYPVVNLSLKAAEQSDFAESLDSLKEVIIREFVRNEHLLESATVAQARKTAFKKLMCGEAKDSAYRSSRKIQEQRG